MKPKRSKFICIAGSSVLSLELATRNEFAAYLMETDRRVAICSEYAPMRKIKKRFRNIAFK
jgi:16S rRNA G966 N2-methylase RsmD